MNALEQELHYPFGDALPDAGATFAVTPDIAWVRMPLPFALDHINLYLMRDEIEGRKGWTLIDCGISNDIIRGLWEQIFKSGLQDLPILRVICTHMHPDHVGLADWITTRFDCRLWMTLGEYALGRVLSAHLPGADSSTSVEHFRRNGVTDPQALDGLRARGDNYFKSLVPSMPNNFRRLRADEPVMINGDSWKIIIGTGHSPEHASLYCDERALLLAGDMVLPRISTNVSVFEIEQEANSVEWFLNSIAQFFDCKADTLVLPSHGKPFKNMHRRIEQLQEHHRDRLLEVAQACEQAPCSAADIVPIMFKRKLDLHQTTFALGEALAHLHALWFRGQLKRVIDAAGVVRFAAK
jgi:glyoxylase-like metal-dependent hydrolase (beta-lactamase superfamily II)